MSPTVIEPYTSWTASFGGSNHEAVVTAVCEELSRVYVRYVRGSRTPFDANMSVQDFLKVFTLQRVT